MISLRKPSEEGRDSSSPKSVIISGLTSMDLRAVFSTTRRDSLESVSSFYCSGRDNRLADAFPDPLCKLNLKETSEFVKAFPMATKCSSRSMGLSENSAHGRREELSSVGKRRVEIPSTPGRPFFSFSPGHPSRKSIPSKWDDAEKWLISSSRHESPAHVTKPGDASKISRQNDVLQQKGDPFAEKQTRIGEEKPPSSTMSSRNGRVTHMLQNVVSTGASSEVLLKDKFTDNVGSLYPNFRFLEPSTESFLFKSSYCKSMKDIAAAQAIAAAATEVNRRDTGTEVTPLGSLTSTRCHTPIKNSSPARHNTPADRSGLLVPCKTSIDISELKDCHFAKLELSAQYDPFVSNWSSREEEEEDVSKSLRHLEVTSGRKSIIESRASIWKEEEWTKSCIRYQREEAKIQAWVNLQSAKAEAQSRKLEVKIQRMRSNLEEKLMKRMAVVHRRAEEWRATAKLHHSQQMQRATEHAQKLKTQQSPHLSGQTICGCFPCNNHHL